MTHCGDEVRHGKPAPDCFRAAAAKLGAAPEDCLVIEDAPSGVQARGNALDCLSCGPRQKHCHAGWKRSLIPAICFGVSEHL